MKEPTRPQYPSWVVDPPPVYLALLPAGFAYGGATVERVSANKKTGAVTLQILTEKRKLTIEVTRTGKVRVFDGEKELR